MHWINYNTREQQAAGLSQVVANQLTQAINERQQANLALPGGTTPGLFMRHLSQQALTWEALHITLTDERQVPPTHERSNALLLQESFLQFIPKAHFIPLYQQNEATQTPDMATLQSALQAILPLDICVLGMGADGHFASLFPGIDDLAIGLDPDNQQAVMAIGGSAVPEPRVSLTLAALLSAQQLHLLITGSAKKQVLEQQAALLEQATDHTTIPVDGLPIAHLLKQTQGRLSVHYCEQ